MKYSEFLQLNEVMEARGTTLRKELGLQTINEIGQEAATAAQEKAKTQKPAATKEALAEKPTVDTEKTTVAGRMFSKWSRMKNTLNKQGKKLQDQINKKLVGKYLPNMIKNELEVIKQIKALSEQNKQPKEIMAAIQGNLKTAKGLQEKQFTVLSKSIDQYLTNSGATLDKKIEASKMKDKNKLDLKNYWLLLKTQIQMNSIDYMQNILRQKSKEALGDDKIATTAYDANDFAGVLDKEKANYEAQMNKQKTVVTSAEEEMKKEPAEGEQQSKQEVLLEKGKVYDYPFTTKKGGTATARITITEMTGEGDNAVVKATSVGGQKFEIKGEDLKKIDIPKGLTSDKAGKYKEQTKPAETTTVKDAGEGEQQNDVADI